MAAIVIVTSRRRPTGRFRPARRARPEHRSRSSRNPRRGGGQPSGLSWAPRLPRSPIRLEASTSISRGTRRSCAIRAEMILLDTNVVSEPMRQHPDRRVQDWLDAQAIETLYF